jgi:hypothetical protein
MYILYTYSNGIAQKLRPQSKGGGGGGVVQMYFLHYDRFPLLLHVRLNAYSENTYSIRTFLETKKLFLISLVDRAETFF